MTQQHLRRTILSSNSNYSDDEETDATVGEALVPRSEMNANKNPLHPGKDGRERLATYFKSATSKDFGSFHRSPLEDDTSYFPDHVARVSYIASVVKPEFDGSYLDDLQGGMKSLATRLAPSYFPGTTVSQITTQVDGYIPSPCPSLEFSNCQDVSASIGVYLSAVPDVEEGSIDNVDGGRVNGSNKSMAAMTDELLAFQESLKAAIANNELQEAIQEEYRRKQDDDINPAVVIVTDSVSDVAVNADPDSGNVENTISIDLNGIFDKINNASGNLVDDSSKKPSNLRPSNATEAQNAEGLRTAAIVTIGVIVAVPMLLISLLVVGKRRRNGGSGSGDATTLKVREKIQRHHRNRHSKLRNSCNPNDEDRDEDGNGNQSDERVLGGIFTATSSSQSGEEEATFTGRTMRTIESDSTRTASSSDSLVRLVASSSSGYRLGNDEGAETNAGSSDFRTSHSNETMKNTADLISSDFVADDGVISFKNDSIRDEDATCIEEAKVKQDDDDDDDENENDFVFGEDDDSEGSVVQHLLSVSKSSECPEPSNSQRTLERSPTDKNDEATSYHTSISRETENSGGEKISQITPSDSPQEQMNPFCELNAAIANEDWATVGATAAIFASNPQPPVRSADLKGFSSPSVTLSDFSQKADELDKLIEAGDWQAVVVTAAKYDAEGEACGGSAIEEDANQSYQSRTSTQGSETNESLSSLIDNSSDGRSMDRSATTSGSQKERLQEIRGQVIQLVRDVAPDEEQNVDEMMIQFKGREQELLETLLNMKERLVARKARVESQKTARRSTRQRDVSEDYESSDSLTEFPNLTDTPTGNDTTIEMNTSSDNSCTDEGGSFESATRVDENKAAEDAAAWAIQRSLDKMMEKEGNL